MQKIKLNRNKGKRFPEQVHVWVSEDQKKRLAEAVELTRRDGSEIIRAGLDRELAEILGE